MSFEAKDIVPVEYQSIFTVLSPIEKMGILKIVKKEFEEIEDKYIRLFKSLEEYLTRYKDEDISELTFIMSGQIAHDLQKKEFIDRMLDIYPKSPELQYFKTLQQVDKGQFENIDELIEKIRLADEERNRIFTRLVSANRLAAIILDLQSFSLEMTYYNAKEDYSEIEKLYEKTEQIWKETLKWTKDKPILFLQEIIVRLITQYTQYLLSAKNLDTALNYFEDPEIQEILNLVESNITKANILHVGATLYFNVGQPHKAIKQMEEAINIIEKVHGRKEWKATVYHSYAYMLNLIDKDKCIEAFEKCYQLAKGTQDY
ncbi:MAG: tetratricopeptide repeat protein, partial [Asgard group archaeon]|nr:tetratricopeptide repeat protein [Asgard group archaeon]